MLIRIIRAIHLFIFLSILDEDLFVPESICFKI